jgi:LuxR family maltose regulon positive regulatory protein
VLTTRQDPPLPLPRLRVRGQVTEIRADDLRFTAEEATAFLHRSLGLTLEAELIGALEARTEGWIAGLQLAALSMQGRPAEGMVDFIAAFSGSHRYVIDYLADEVLAQQPAEVRDFLRQTAILDRLTAPLCDAVTGRDDSAARLKQLEQANLFLIPLDDRREWYRYHQLFADFLRTDLDEARATPLHLRATRWLAAHDLFPEAVKHALASGDIAEAAQVIARAADEAFRSASFLTLLGWLDALPDELVRANHVLATYKGYLLFLTERRGPAATYANAAEQSLPPDAPPFIRGRLLSLKAHLALFNGTLDVTIRVSREALDCLDEGDVVFRSLTLNVLGQALEIQGDLAAAADVYREGAPTGRRAGDQLGALVAHTNLVFALNELGRRREAVALCQQVISTARSGRGLPIAEGSYLAWSLLSYEANDLDIAREQVLRALDLCEQANISDGILWAQYILAQLHLVKGEFDALSQVCQQGRQRAALMSLETLQGAWFAALEAQASLAQGDLAAATCWAEAAGLAPADTPMHWHEVVYFTYVRTLLAQNRPQEAQTLLTTMERAAQQNGRRRKLITINVQQALVHKVLGQEQQALARIENGLRLAAPEGYRRAFLDEGSAVRDLLTKARHVAPAFVDELLQAFTDEGQRTDDESIRPSTSVLRPLQGTLVEPLSARELEILRLIAAGRSNPEIAELLYLSLNTIKWHVKNLYGKLDVHNRVEAVARAQELGLF